MKKEGNYKEKCKRKKVVNGWEMCRHLNIPCVDVKDDDCPMKQEIKLPFIKRKDD